MSISLAYRTANRAKVDEDNLSYGFKKAPVDQPRVKIVKNIPEEKLWAIERSVIELKKPKARLVEVDAEEEEEEDDNGPRDCSNPGYAELGYAPVVKRKIAKRRKIHDFRLEPLRRSSDYDDRPEFEDEECICKRGEIIKISDDDDNYDSPEAVYSSNDYDA